MPTSEAQIVSERKFDGTDLDWVDALEVSTAQDALTIAEKSNDRTTEGPLVAEEDRTNQVD